jgi:hypothetical protein
MAATDDALTRPDAQHPIAAGPASAQPHAQRPTAAGPAGARAGGDGPAAAAPAEQAVLAGLVVFAVYHLALAIFMAAAPHAFYRAVGPFGPFNSHYVRDTASFEAALGFGLLIAIRRPSWRVPVLAVVTVQFALHSANHLLDIGSAHPRWTGYFDFFSLLVSTALLLWLWRSASRGEAETSRQRRAT